MLPNSQLHTNVVFVVNKPPVITTKPESAEILEDELAEFCCLVEGKPVPEITWYKGDQPIVVETGIDVTISENPDSFEAESTLSISQTILQDEGQYRVEAVNPIGKDKQKFTLEG